MLNIGVQESKTALGTVETDPYDEALLDGGVTKVVWRAPSINGLSLSFCPLTQSLVLDRVEAAAEEDVVLDELDPAVKVVEWVDCEGAVVAELYTLAESLLTLIFGDSERVKVGCLCTGLLENWPE